MRDKISDKITSIIQREHYFFNVGLRGIITQSFNQCAQY